MSVLKSQSILFVMKQSGISYMSQSKLLESSFQSLDMQIIQYSGGNSFSNYRKFYLGLPCDSQNKNYTPQSSQSSYQILSLKQLGFSQNVQYASQAQNSSFIQTPQPQIKLQEKVKLSEDQKIECQEELVKKQQHDYEYLMYQPVYDKEYLESEMVGPNHHHTPKTIGDRVAYTMVYTLKNCWDFFTGFKPQGPNTLNQWLMRVLYLETIAGVPGMVAAMLRHMMSLRTMKRDNGWIHTLLEDAENERMHLLTFMTIKQPGLILRFMVLMGQGIFFNLFLVSYLFSPRVCHRFVGYLEEMAVKTYTELLHEIKGGDMVVWKTQPAPEIAVQYWKLKPNATMEDVIYAIRADEANHRHINHTFANMKKDDHNPFKKGQHTIPKENTSYGPQA